MNRRRFVKLAGTVSAVGVAGCIDGEEEPEPDDGADDDMETDDEPDDNGEEEPEITEFAEVIAGPDGAWRFEPREVHIEVGGTVEWYFDSRGHNVSAHPDDDSLVSIPDDAEPFRSFDRAERRINDVGETFSRTFDVPGEYVYVCTPHVPDMRGTVVVHEV